MGNYRRYFEGCIYLLMMLMLTAPARSAEFSDLGTPAETSYEDFTESFKFPPARYGSAPFWSWNEVLEPEELTLQIDEFAEKGMGGFFMHAREGLITEYMGPEWMEAVRLSVDRAKEKGLIAYMYDEDRWPSGFASGKVPKMSDDFKQKALKCVKADEPLAPGDENAEGVMVRVFEAEMDGQQLISFKDITPADGAAVPAPADGNKLLYFFMLTAEPSEWFNGGTYIDAMNPDAVDAFINVTHEKYREVIGDEFGKTSPAIFTDEPEYFARRHFSPSSLPWTQRLPGEFEKSHGYDLMGNLPLLIYNGQGQSKVRLDFRTTATEMFRDAFSKRIYEWGEKYNVQLTGHYMLEDTLQSQIWRIGAAMPQYEYMQFPGMDHLGRNIDNLMTAKQVSSAAHQFNRPLILTETYGCSGWNLSFEDMKWIADWHYALGVNFMNQHLSWYSMRGARKRDYPTTIQYPSPWWKYHNMIADYLRRTTFTTAQGSFVAETLMLHPITSAWASYSPIDQDETDKLNADFDNLLYTFTGHQVDYDLGDEILISRHGAVRGGKFIVKDSEYSSVVIPPSIVLRASTKKLLEEFAAQGGKIIAVGGNEYAIDGEESFTLKAAEIAGDSADAVTKLSPALKRKVNVITADGGGAEKLFLHQREVDGTTFLFFANTDRWNAIDVTAELPYTGPVKKWNLFDGTAEDLPCETRDGKTIVPLHFEMAGSVLLSVTPGEEASAEQEAAPELVRTQQVPDEWEITSRGPNAVTIDYVRYQRDGDKALMPLMSHLAAQDSMQSKGSGFSFRVQYYFTLGVEPEAIGPMNIVMEQPDRMDISLNGTDIEYHDEGWWIDKAFRKIGAGGYMKKGKNTLQITGTFMHPKKPDTRIYLDEGTEIESVYVTGDFGVVQTDSGKFVIVPPNGTFSYGDMAEKGYPFYSGSMTIKKNVDIDPEPGERAFIEIDGLEAITAKVTVNEKEAGVIAFHPHRVDVTDLLVNGPDTLEIELTTSNRNLLGPHHTEQREPLNVGPGSFKSEMLKRQYNFIPFGISGGVNVAYYK